MAKKKSNVVEVPSNESSKGLSSWCLGSSECSDCPNNFKSFTCSCECHVTPEE